MNPSMNRKIHLTRKQLLAPENLFLAIGYLFGLCLVFVNPPFHSNDEDRHFYNSYFLSTGQVRPVQQGNRIGGYLPQNLYNVSEAYQGIPFGNGFRINPANLAAMKKVPLNESSRMFYDNPSYQINPVPYCPFVIGIWIAKMVNSNPVHLLWGARMAGLFAFLCIVFFAIKIMPVHKYLLCALALNPMTLFQAASVTYDVMSFSLSFLLVALALKYACGENRMTNGAIALFLLVSLVHYFAKPGYFLIPFLFFIIPERTIGSWKRSVAVFACLCLFCFLPSITWGNYLASLHLTGGKVLNKDFYCSAGEQCKVFSQAPLAAVFNFFLNVIVQGREWIIGCLGRLGYSYTHLNHTVLFVHGLVLIALSVFDSSKARALSSRQKLLCGSIAFGSLGLIAAGFYTMSPVGARVIFGLQGRYFIPVLPVLFLLNAHRTPWTAATSAWAWDAVKPLVVPLYASALLAYTVIFIRIHFYL
jgi:uncharacterized membrane protein